MDSSHRLAALDIGGANIKAADPGGAAFTVPFELWRRRDELPETLRRLIAGRFLPVDVLAVTMTGELCDCYASRAEGVVHIVESVLQARDEAAPGAEIIVWRTDQRLVPAAEALRDPLPVAAANWLALACLVGLLDPSSISILVDVGSTTTDIVPVALGRPVPAGLTDTQRLIARELLYAGITRTPVAALVHEIPYRSSLCPVASELFATTRDACLILGHLEEDANDLSTADGRPATRACARARLARMACADPPDFGEEDAVRAAKHIVDAFIERLLECLRTVEERCPSAAAAFVTSGSGEVLARRAVERYLQPRARSATSRARIVSLAEELGPEASTAAPAVALRRIAIERLR